MRIVLVSFDFGEYCIRLASALAKHAEVLLALPSEEIGPNKKDLNANVSLVCFQKPRVRQVFRQFQVIRALLQGIRNFQPDVVHYQGVHLWFDLALPLLHQYPLVFTVHDFRPHPGDQLLRQTPFFIEMHARRCADELIVHNHHARELLVRHWGGAAGRVSVIPHIQIGQTSTSRADEEQENSVLFFGRIWPYKGLEYLIRAEPLISARVPNVRIVIAGQGEDFSRYARMMTHPDRFIVQNEYIPNERAVEYFRRASVIVLPYIEASQSGVIPMAYSAAKPVVATTVGGIPEMVEEGRTGYLVAPRSMEQLAEAVTRLLLDPRLRHQMGANGKRKIEAECSPAVVAERTIEAYRRAIERVRTRKAPEVVACSAAMQCPAPTAGAEEDIYIQK